jgi:excisionase family DNA binding protein
MIDQQLLRPREAADVLGLCRSKTYQLLRDGTLPVVRIGKSVRVSKEALSEWIRAEVERGKGKGKIARQRSNPTTGRLSVPAVAR